MTEDDGYASDKGHKIEASEGDAGGKKEQEK